MDVFTPDAEPSAQSLIAAHPALSVHPIDGLLCEGVPLAGIEAAYGTPSYVYSAATLRARLVALRAAMPGVSVHYAVKALDHLAVLALLAKGGAGADVVSGGEFLRARRAGINAERMVFSGVGKTRAEMALVLGEGIGQINVESAEELAALSEVARALGVTARVALRVNPDVDAGTHSKIATGRAGDKFGIPLADAASLYAHAAALPGIAPVGLAVHIGSQIHRMASFSSAYGKLAALVIDLRAAGHVVEAMDCGGGLGIAYAGEPQAQPAAWFGAIKAAFGGLDLHLAIEPGRWLAGPAGLLLASVIRTRRAGQMVPIVVLDAAMNDLLRPAMYGAWHGIVPVAAASLLREPELADIVGPVCESSDIFARQRAIAPLSDTELVAILDTGAYGSVMSSTYNARPLAAQIMVDGGRATLIRRRQSVEDLWRDDVIGDTQEFSI